MDQLYIYLVSSRVISEPPYLVTRVSAPSRRNVLADHLVHTRRPRLELSADHSRVQRHVAEGVRTGMYGHESPGRAGGIKSVSRSKRRGRGR
jgi:hypothetical protein